MADLSALQRLRSHLESGNVEDQLSELSRRELEAYALDLTVKYLYVAEQVVTLTPAGGVWN